MKFDIDIEALKKYLLPHLEELKDFEFSYLNPLFWVSLFVIFLILSRFWGERRKAFSFSVISGLILLGMTKTEVYFSTLFGDSLVPFLVRMISLFIASIVFLYYVFIK